MRNVLEASLAAAFLATAAFTPTLSSVANAAAKSQLVEFELMRN